MVKISMLAFQASMEPGLSGSKGRVLSCPGCSNFNPVSRLHCAELAGVPSEILERAAYILSVTNDQKPIDRHCNESLSTKDQQYKDVAEKLVAFDFMNSDVEAFMKAIFSSNPQIDL
eukprot:Gb_04619 [translate_table: standard]